jgi:hypothetical protein
MRTKESVRGLAVATLGSLAARTSDAAAARQVVVAVKNVLDGTAEGKIKVCVCVCVVIGRWLNV